MKIIKVKYEGVDDVYLKPEEVAEWVDNLEPHKEITIETLEMTEEEYKKLPEFRG